MKFFRRSSSCEAEREKLIFDVKPRLKFGVRHVQLLLCLALLTIGYTMRVNLSVAIVAMTDNSTSPNPDVPTYDWEDTGTVLSSFFWGYIVLQVFAGQLAKKHGPRYYLVGAMTVNSVASFMVPTLAESWGSEGVMFCRILQGLSQGFFFPSCHTLLGQWAPVSERSTSGTFIYSGAALGTIIGMPITGAIAASWAGWPASFYFFGTLGLFWVIAWILLGSNKPSEHKYITEEERSYIETSLGHEKHIDIPTPWKSIFTSWPAWAIIVASFGQNWGYSTLLTNIPTYMSKITKFEMSKNSALSAAPYLALAIFSYIFGPISDFLMNRGIMSRGGVRKLMNTIGTVLPAIALTCLGFVPDDQPTLSVVLLVIAVGSNAAVFCGFQVNHIDLSPNHSGTLMGIANGSSNIFSIISPLVVQFVVTDQTDKNLWRIIFIIAAAVYVVADIFYVIFASGELQPWNDESEVPVDLEAHVRKIDLSKSD